MAPLFTSKGSRVTWRSQAGGCTKTKVGVIVAILPPGGHPTAVVHEVSPYTIPRGVGEPRNHESYLVHVEGRRELYWPRVSSLRGAE